MSLCNLNICLFGLLLQKLSTCVNGIALIPSSHPPFPSFTPPPCGLHIFPIRRMTITWKFSSVSHPPNLYKHISACKAFGKGTRYTSWIVFVIVLKSLCQHAGRQRVNAVCRQQCCSRIFEITVAETDVQLHTWSTHDTPSPWTLL